MYHNFATRRGRRWIVVIWLSILTPLFAPAQSLLAQDDGRLYLPLVNTPDEGKTGDSEAVTSLFISPQNQKAALEFWTHDALAAAQPMVLAMEAGPATVDEAALALPEIAAAPGFSPPGAAAPGADSVAQAIYAEDWAALAEELDSPSATDGSSATYTYYIVNQNTALWTLYPHRWVGRLSYKTPNGTSYCTGTSISNNIMLTAAHCLYDTTNNKWYSNFVFTPAYRNGSAPYGSFPAATCRVLTAWINLTGTFNINGWARHDVGVCNMGKNSAGTTLNNAVGFMGRQWNYPIVRHFHLLGYPFRDTNDALLTDAGLYLRVCIAESFQQTTDTRGMGCPISRGASGGPWMVGYAPGVIKGVADGVYSGFFIGTANAYGARFTSNNIVPLCNVAGC